MTTNPTPPRDDAPAPYALPVPEDRPDGFECLAFHRGKWTHVRWVKAHKGFILGYGGAFIIEGDRAFAELPLKPENSDGFYDYR